MENIHDEYSDLSDENFYLSIGKITPWTTDNDSRIPSIDSVKDDTDFWRGMVAAKRINRGDASMVIRRVDWIAGKVYQPYRDTIDLYDDTRPSDFYALVDEERVYVCIDNSDGSPSLYAPTHTDNTVRKLADGYRWRFLYSIPESKRKFMTRSEAGKVGYIPIQFVESLRLRDDRTAQWNIQQTATNGKIEFAYLDIPARTYWASTQSCLFPSSSNKVVSTVAPGGTTVDISSSGLIPVDEYSDMMFTIEGGPGQGQRRVIKSYSWNTLGNYASIVIDPLIVGISGSEVGANTSYYSITPRVTVQGDGFGSSTLNPTIRTADFSVKFGETANVGDNACLNFVPKLLSSIEVIDGGRDYTFADLNIPKGITSLPFTPKEFLDFKNLIHAVMPPPGGHGANAVRELGSSAYMIVSNFSQDEDGKVEVGNDYRQIGILKSPLLAEKQVRIKFYQAGLSGSFIVGSTAGYDVGGGPYGRVLEWCRGSTGVTATSELVLGDIRGGTFAPGATMTGLVIYDVLPITHAGKEGRHLLDLNLASTNNEFSAVGNDYLPRHFAHGLGNQTTNIPQSRSSGYIRCWELDPGTLKTGKLSLEFSKGNFTVGEFVGQTTPIFGTSNGYSGPGRIVAIDTSLENVPSVYDLTTTVDVTGTSLTSTTFTLDTQVYFAQGLTSGNGYIIDWTVASGGTSGTLRLSGVQGSLTSGQEVEYVILDPGAGTTADVSATIKNVSHKSELKYRSGEILYIQNVNPISRDIEQREEIKLVIEL